MSILKVANLEKSFKQRKAVDDVSFEVDEGEIFGVLGPNGAGKSTTLGMICGLIKPERGSITIAGVDMASQPAQAKKFIGIVPQEPAIYPELSARANLEFWGEINGLTKSELGIAVDSALQIVGLKDRARERSSKLSGGMRRRLNIAAGMLHNPKLLVMDEPTVGVDPQSRNHILETVKNLKTKGTSVIYTSHYVEEVEQICDRVAIMDHGKILAIGTLAELQHQAGEHNELIITCRTSVEKQAPFLKNLPWIHDCICSANTIKILTASAELALPHIFELLTDNQLQVAEIKINKPNLESLFLKLTGRALRD